VLLRKNVDWVLSLRLTRQGKFGFVPEPLILMPTSLDPVVSAARVSRSVRQGARSFMRISGKLRRQSVGGTVLDRHHGMLGRASPIFQAYLAKDPVQPETWVALPHQFLVWHKFPPAQRRTVSDLAGSPKRRPVRPGATI